MELTPINKLLDLTGKTAVVTGAAGIGYGIAYRLAEAGANVMIACRNETEAIESAKKLIENGWKAKATRAGVSSEEDVKNMVHETISMYGSIDILVNNAGIYPSIPVMQMALADFEKVLSVNLKGVFLCTRYTADQMIK